MEVEEKFLVGNDFGPLGLPIEGLQLLEAFF